MLFDIASSSRLDALNRDGILVSAESDGMIVLSVLEIHSINAMNSEVATLWTANFLPLVAQLVSVSVRKPYEAAADFQALALRLALPIPCKSVTSQLERRTSTRALMLLLFFL